MLAILFCIHNKFEFVSYFSYMLAIFCIHNKFEFVSYFICYILYSYQIRNKNQCDACERNCALN